jgi:hypothetical protein
MARDAPGQDGSLVIRFRYALILGLVAMLVAAMLSAACGGGEDGGTPTPGDGTPTPGEATPTPTDTGADPGDQEFAVNQEFWHAGFHVTLGNGDISTRETLDGRTLHFVSIDATFENLGPDETSFFSPVSLVQDGTAFIPSGDNTDIPRVPSGLSSDGTLVYLVEEDFDADRAQLVVGSGEENQALVPLGPQGGDLVTLEPSEPPISGSISMELIDLTFTSAELRADIPASYREIEAGRLGLTINFDATSRSSGNWRINAQNLALTLPSGSSVGADGAELPGLPGSDAGTDTPGLFVRFLVDDMPAGDYTLRFTPGDWFVGDDGVTEATFDFTLE